MPITFQRQATAKNRLQIDWNLPVYAPDLEQQVEAGRTSSGRALVALPRAQAFAEIRGDDRRPLLVVRECGFCKGTDDALLSRRMSNEKTILITGWFRCIKLPNHVLRDNHPFRQLFEGDHPPHLFLCRWDGSEAFSLDGQQTQAELWAAMTALLQGEYRGDVEKAVKGRLRVLNDYDTIDSQEQELRDRLEKVLDEAGPNSPKLKSIRQKLDRLAARREELEQREQELRDLGLRSETAASSGSTGG